MRHWLQRLLAFVVVLCLAPWEQTELCPMKLLPQKAKTCHGSGPATHPSRRQITPSHQHDCCPPGLAAPAIQSLCPTDQLSACNSNMTCCSAHSQPVGTPAVKTTRVQLATVAYLDLASRSVPNRRASDENGCQTSPHSPVFRLKEDLRI